MTAPLWRTKLEGHPHGAQVRVIIPTQGNDWRGPAVVAHAFPTLAGAQDIAQHVAFEQWQAMGDEWLAQYSQERGIEPALSIQEQGPLTRERAALWEGCIEYSIDSHWLCFGAHSGYFLTDEYLFNVRSKEERELFLNVVSKGIEDTESVRSWCEENAIYPPLSQASFQEGKEDPGREAQVRAFVRHIHDIAWREEIEARRLWLQDEQVELSGWSDEEKRLAELLKHGQAVVISQSVNGPHKHLLAWSQARGSHAYVGRRIHWQGHPQSDLANPFTPKKYGRAECIKMFRQHLFASPDLLKEAEALAGCTLGCWCFPESCHGEVIAEVANEVGISYTKTTVELINEHYQKPKPPLRS